MDQLLFLLINNAPGRRSQFRDVPFAFAAMAPVHVRPSGFAAVLAGDKGDFRPGQPVGDISCQTESNRADYPE